MFVPDVMKFPPGYSDLRPVDPQGEYQENWILNWNMDMCLYDSIISLIVLLFLRTVPFNYYLHSFDLFALYCCNRSIMRFS